MSYAPWDDGLPFSTVNLDGGPTVLAVWGLIVASKDQDGITNLNPGAVVGLWSNSREPRTMADVQAAWDYLAAPDPRSKNRDEGGRRIIPTEDGRWLVVSHAKYREKYRVEKRRRQLSEAQARHRDKQRGGSDGADGRATETVPPHDGDQEQRGATGDGPAQPAAALSLPDEIHNAGASTPAAGPAADPVQGEAVGAPRRGAGSGPDAHQHRIRITREATGESVPLEESFKATVQYPTEADRRAANAEAGELCVWLEGRCGRSSGEVFRAAADYSGANGFKTRADGCSPARLEQTLLTLREWKRRCELNMCGIEASWALKPRPGEAAPRTNALDDAAERIQRRLEEEHAGRGAGTGADRAVDAGRAALPGGDAEVG